MFHHTDTVVELIGWDVLDTFVSHRHAGIALETCGTQHSHQHAGFVLADATAVSEVHLCTMKGIALAFSHTDTCIADIVSHPVGQDADAVLLVFGIFQQFLYLGRNFGGGIERAVILVDAIEPHRFRLPIGCRGQYQLALKIVVGHHGGFGLDGHDVMLHKAIYHSVVDNVHVGRQIAIVHHITQVFVGQHADFITLYPYWIFGPEGDDIVEMAFHRWDVTGIVVAIGQQGIGVAFAIGAKVQLVIGIEMSHLYHLLAGTPVNQSGGRHIVVNTAAVLFLVIYHLDASVGTTDFHIQKLYVGREWVVVDGDDIVVFATRPVKHFDSLVVVHMA